MIWSPQSLEIIAEFKKGNFKRVEELFKRNWDEIEEKHMARKIDWFWRKKEITLEDVYYDYSKIRVKVLFTFGQYCDKLKAQGWRIV